MQKTNNHKPFVKMPDEEDILREFKNIVMFAQNRTIAEQKLKDIIEEVYVRGSN